MAFLFEWRNAFREEGPDQLTTRAVGLALALYADTETGEAHPKQSTLAKDLATRRQTVSEHLSIIEEEGWISSKRTMQGKEYTLRIPDAHSSSDIGCTSNGHSNVNEADIGCTSNGHSNVNEADIHKNSHSNSHITPSKNSQQKQGAGGGARAGGHDRDRGHGGDATNPEAPEPRADSEPRDDESSNSESSAGPHDEAASWDDLLELEDPSEFLMALADHFDCHLPAQSASSHWSAIRNRVGFEVDAREVREFIAEKVLDLVTDEGDYSMRKMLEIARDDISDGLAEQHGAADEPDDTGAHHETYIPEEHIPDGTEDTSPPDPEESQRPSRDPVEAFAPDDFLDDMEGLDHDS